MASSGISKSTPATSVSPAWFGLGFGLKQGVQHRFREVIEINQRRRYEEVHLEGDLCVSGHSLKTRPSWNRNAASDVLSPWSFTLSGPVASARYWSLSCGVDLC
jgi:hypothetical protein